MISAGLLIPAVVPNVISSCLLGKSLLLLILRAYASERQASSLAHSDYIEQIIV